MTLFYSSEMPEFKIMKHVYAQRVHKFVDDWLGKQGSEELRETWKSVSRTRLGNLLRPDTIRPKKYKNMYICFCEIQRPKLQEEHPEKSIEEITKLLGKQWKDFSEESEPDLYRKVLLIWEIDQKRYATEKELSGSLKKPKRAMDSSYITFCKTLRDREPKISMRELALKWADHKKSV